MAEHVDVETGGRQGRGTAVHPHHCLSGPSGMEASGTNLTCLSSLFHANSTYHTRLILVEYIFSTFYSSFVVVVLQLWVHSPVQYRYQVASCSLVTDNSAHVWDLQRPYTPVASFTDHKDLVTGALAYFVFSFHLYLLNVYDT